MKNASARVLLLVLDLVRRRRIRRGEGDGLGLGGLTNSSVVCRRSIARVRPTRPPTSFRLGFGRRAHVVGMCAVSADMLLHIVLAGEGLVADGTVDTLLARVLFPVSGGVARRRECSRTPVARRIRAWILVLAARAPRSSRLRRCYVRARRRLPLGRRPRGSGPAGRKAIRVPPRVLPGVWMIGRRRGLTGEVVVD